MRESEVGVTSVKSMNEATSIGELLNPSTI